MPVLLVLLVLARPGLTGATPRATGLDAPASVPPLAAAFLQRTGRQHLRVASSADVSCSPLRNHGSHFTVEIEVGTPGQRFDVVADTGSDNVIVADCICNDLHKCNWKDKCFRGTNHSSTFLMAEAGGEVQELVITFGSGQIAAVLATDQVRVGEVEATMNGSLLLMVDRALDISGPFEGILGLGLPKSGDQEPPPPSPFSPRRQLQPHGPEPKGFLEQAGVSRFSMCFNSNADGVLRLGTPAEPGALGSIGVVHWGLDFRGVSVGSESAPVAFCSPAHKLQGQQTACGAIPDSGTTIMMGAERHLRSLFEELCDRWPRCQKEVERSRYMKFELFQSILLNCADWMTDERGMDELPPIYFHLAGADGTQRTLKLDGSSYVFTTKEDEMKYVVKNLFGIFPVEIAVPTGRKRDVCVPAFGSHKYDTLRNGPIWILGTPLFYKFQVGYDLKATPPSVTFADRPCGSCGGASLLSGDAWRSAAVGHRKAGRPWEVHGPLRVRRLDPNAPL